MVKTMFNGRRYVTSGVMERIPLGVQLFLWNLIDTLCAIQEVEPDYLQVFQLEPSKQGGQRIAHSQEIPSYIAEYVFDNVPKPLKEKVYVIADDGQATMLLPEER